MDLNGNNTGYGDEEQRRALALADALLGGAPLSTGLSGVLKTSPKELIFASYGRDATAWDEITTGAISDTNNVVTMTVDAIVGPISGSGLVFEDSFEDTTPGLLPNGWSGTGWTVETADGSFDGGNGDFTGADGANVIIGSGTTTGIFRSIDLTGFENSDLFISILANDGAGGDTTLEGTDDLFIEYQFGAGIPATWLTAIEETGDIAPGGGNTEMLQFNSSGVTILPAGQDTLWLRIRQNVSTPANEAFAVDRIRVEATGNAEYSIRQSKQRFQHQIGLTQTIAIGAVLSPEANVCKRIGYFSSGIAIPFTTGRDGFWFVSEASGPSIVIGNNGTETKFAQSDWNIDKLDGNGASGIILDMGFAQVFVIEFEWYGPGSVRFGFKMGDRVIYVHKYSTEGATAFNTITASPNKPVRAEIESLGGAGSLLVASASVLGAISSEETQGRQFSATVTVADKLDAAAVGTLYAGFGIRQLASASDGSIKLSKFSAIVSTANDVTEWEIRSNPVVTGAFDYTDVDTINGSIAQVAFGDTPNTVTGGQIIRSGIVYSRRQFEVELNRFLGFGIAGQQEELVFCFRPLVGGAQDIYCDAAWIEF